MPSLNIGQMGHTPTGRPALKSTPKLTRINGDDALPIVYRNMGNNHAYPFIFAGTLSEDDGTYTIMSGVKLHGMPAAEYSFVTVGGTENTAPYVTKDTVANTVSITMVSGTVDYMVMIGLSDYNIEDIACRGNTGARQMLP